MIRLIYQDNGVGIDLARLKETLAGNSDPKISEIASRKDNYQLIRSIFLPGVSMAKEMTETSGRGVGMDAVRSLIEELGGNVDFRFEVQGNDHAKLCGSSICLKTYSSSLLIRNQKMPPRERRHMK